MSAETTAMETIPTRSTAPSQPAPRGETRIEVVRRVEYAPYPRALPSQRERVGFTRDVSASGMCLRLDDSEPLGSLLRVVPSGVDGRPVRESIARVVWSSPTRDGGWWMGLALLEPRPVLQAVPAGRVRNFLKGCA